jgi:hypothetical protein
MGGGQKAPQAYTPQYQGQSDQAYNSTLNALTQQNQAAASAINTGYNNTYNAIVNNPYDASMLAGINAAANSAAGVGASDLAQGAALTNQADQGYADANTVRGYAPTVAGYADQITAQAAPMTADANAVSGYGDTVASYAPGLQALARQAAGYANPMAADANTLRSYAPYLAEMGFDPNNSEYNFGLKQTQDAQNVQNAESGLSGSPFAAGATGDAMAAYKRNWDAAKFGKGMQAIAALQGLYSGAGGLDMNAIQALLSSGQLTGESADALSTAAGMKGQSANIRNLVAGLYPQAAGMYNDAAGLYGDANRIASNAGNMAIAGSDLSHSGYETQAEAAAMPYSAYNQIYGDQEAALNNWASGNAAVSAPLASDVQGYGNYMDIGQNATSLDQRAAQINNQNSFMGQLGQVIGLGLGIGAHFIPGYQ